MTVSIIQINSGLDKQNNLCKVKRLLERAQASRPDVIVLPEYVNYFGPLSTARREGEAGGKSDWYATFSGFAADNHVDIVAGLLKQTEDGKAASCAVHFPKGDKTPVEYMKMHLFDIDLGDEVVIKESAFLARGKAPVTSIVSGIPSGFAVCYDLRFPELFRSLTVRGIRVVFLPAAFTHTTGRAHWELLVRARAVENQLFIIAANQVGPSGAGQLSYGHSMIVDPWGRITSRAPGIEHDEKECILTGEIDFSIQDNIRKELPCLDHIRRDVFSLQAHCE
ncbi:MAG: hypothetical protein JW881_05065 [Spirochaetales bacterium]|nr:hypothetical protein [Spirochaetales bacterium]